MKIVEQSIPKVDGMGLVTGKPAYTDDLAPSNALIVKVLRSPYAFAKIKKIDKSEAEKMNGVIAVITYEDVPQNIITRAGQGYPEPSPHDKRILDQYVRYIGDEVAAVAAIDQDTAEAALKLIKVEYEVFEPVLNFEEAIDNKTIIHPEDDCHEMFPIGFEPKRNIAAAYEMNVGDVEKELRNCEIVVKERFYSQAQAHVTSEPHSCFAYVDFNERLIVVTSTQTPFHVRRIIGHALNLPNSKIRVIKPRVGGGYGGKQQVHGELIVSALALKTKMPCKLIYTRKEVFESTFSRHPMRFDVSIGSDKEGNLKALDVKLLSDTGAYGEHALTVFMVAASKTLPLYNKVNAVRFGGDVVYTNRGSAGAFRGYGAIQGNFALESTIDILAEKLRIDPIELRKKNMIAEGETSKIFEIMGEGTSGTPMIVESCKLNYCVERAIEMINEKEFIKEEGNFVRGRGCAIAMQGSGIPYIDMASSILKLNDDGFFNLLIGATDIGTGSDTILSQIAAEALGVSIDKVIPYSSDTDLTPFDTGAYASSTTYVTGHAVKRAALEMKEKLLKEACRYLSIEKDDIDFDGELFFNINGNEKVTLKELSNKLYYNEEQKQLVSSGSYFGKKSPPPFMCAIVEVEINKNTGVIRVSDYVGVVDCGTTINPNLAKIQVEGGLLQGIGMALYEDVKYDEKGHLLTNTTMTYKIPTRTEVERMRVEFAKSYEPSGPYGAKSVGEIGIDTPPAAIANAVYNAIGIRINDLPITPEKILIALKNKL